MTVMKADDHIQNTEPSSRNISSNLLNIPMEMPIAEATSMFPGFRFSPTDEELIQFYLKKKLQGCNEAVEVIAEVDICRYEPWDLPAKSIIHSDNEWFYFSPRGRKYPNGSQSKRATESGYWKATGKERIIKSGSNVIGTKRTLVFHTGRAPRGQRSAWIMHEYTTSERSQDAMVVCRLRRNSEFHLHLHEDPGRNVSPRDGESTSLSNGAVNLSGGETLEGPKVLENGNVSKEYSSNHNNSQSVEEVKNESDSWEEDDFYADIMKDDIIKLDEMPNTPISIMQHGSEMLVNQPVSASSQGTANRRLRLRRLISNTRLEQPQIQNVEKEIVDCNDAYIREIDLELKSRKWLMFVFLFVFVLLMLALLYVMLSLSSSRILK